MPPKQLYDKQVIEQVKEILELKGWLKDRYSIEGYQIVGKTGTARRVKKGKYSKKDHVYTYAAVVEKGKYKRVIITFIEEPKKTHLWATQVTTPLFHKVAEKMIVYDVAHGIVDK